MLPTVYICTKLINAMAENRTERVILGIDPGTTVMGYGVISDNGKSMKMLAMGVLKLSKFTSQPLRLRKIFERTLALVEQYKPDEFSIEAPFFGKNVQSMLKLGRAQGVAMAAALYRDIPIFEYSPLQIKKSITGNGNASKDQVAAMLNHLLKFEHNPDTLDATDGLAAAVCHYFKRTKSPEGKSYTGWKSFLTENPDRVK
jgi:crossover junction endodeoxyribonuclease RuvC